MTAAVMASTSRFFEVTAGERGGLLDPDAGAQDADQAHDQRPDYRDYEDLLLPLLVVLGAPGEFGLVGWLLLRGGKGEPAGVSDP
jgi:hypothetical protein